MTIPVSDKDMIGSEALQSVAEEPKRSLRISIIEGSFATVHIAITTSSLVTAYALFCQAGDFSLGLLAALSNFATIGSIISVYLLNRGLPRRPLTVWSATIGRLLWGLLCFLPFLPWNDRSKLITFLCIVFFATISINTANNAWLSWMADLVPLSRRGFYFGVRNTLISIVTMATTYGTGLLFDWFREKQSQAFGFTFIFGLACLSAIVAGIILNRQWDPPRRQISTLSLLDMVRLPFSHPKFRFLLLFFFFWSVLIGIGSPFYVAHMIKHLHMSFAHIALYSIVAGIFNLTTLPLWGKIIDRIGNRPVMAFNIIGVFSLPLFWLFATPSFILPIWIDALLSGLFWPGFTLAAFNLVLISSPEENRPAYLAVHSMVVGFALLIASLIAGLLATLFADFHWHFHGQHFLNFHILFLITALGRLCMFPIAIRLDEEKAQSVTTLLDLVGDKVSRTFSEVLNTSFILIRKVAHSHNQINHKNSRNESSK
ncbi:MFS transporter [bacterium]|nr:MFS transporter [bacterium]